MACLKHFHHKFALINQLRRGASSMLTPSTIDYKNVSESKEVSAVLILRFDYLNVAALSPGCRVDSPERGQLPQKPTLERRRSTFGYLLLFSCERLLDKLKWKPGKLYFSVNSFSPGRHNLTRALRRKNPLEVEVVVTTSRKTASTKHLTSFPPPCRSSSSSL